MNLSESNVYRMIAVCESRKAVYDYGGIRKKKGEEENNDSTLNSYRKLPYCSLKSVCNLDNARVQAAVHSILFSLLLESAFCTSLQGTQSFMT